MGAATDPVYLRVAEDLRAQIRDGVLGPGARVPSRNGIIAKYGVGETAAKHALAVLAAEGLIEPRAGSGSYVRAGPAPRRLEHDRPHFPGSPFGLAGASAGPEVLSWQHQTQQVPASRQVARRLRLAAGDPVTRTRYLCTAGDSPVQLAVSYEPAALTAGSAAALPEEGPLAGRGVIERMRVAGIEVDEVVEDISTRPCASDEAASLALPAGAAVLVVAREHRCGGRAVETAEIVVAADRFRLRYRIPVTRIPVAAPQPAAAGARLAGLPAGAG